MCSRSVKIYIRKNPLYWKDIKHKIQDYISSLYLYLRIMKFIENNTNYTGLQGFVVEKLWVVSGVIFDVESESGIRIRNQNQPITSGF